MIQDVVVILGGWAAACAILATGFSLYMTAQKKAGRLYLINRKEQ